MTFQGILVLDFLGILLLLQVLNLVRRGRLYVGYGVIFVMSIVAAILIVSVPRALWLVTHLLGAVFPTSALTLAALGFIVFMLVYILTQLTIISNRLATVVQELAILRAAEESKNLPSEFDGGGVRKGN